MIEPLVVAKKVAALHDAVHRVNEVLPDDADAFVRDRTTREVVALNLFVALQEAIALATHWLADAGETVPNSYRDLFTSLADSGRLDADLATRLAAAAGFRNLFAHRYGVLDWRRVHDIAQSGLPDLEAFAAAVAQAASEP